VCGREPHHEEAIYCGHDGAMYHVAMLQLVPPHRPLTTVYLDRQSVTIGRNDPEQGFYPEVDLTAADAARHVSRRHATIRRDGTRFTLALHATTNPNRLDGEPLRAPAEVAVEPGARLEFGDLVAVLVSRPVLDPEPEVNHCESAVTDAA